MKTSNTPGPLGQRLATELRAELGRQRKSGRWLANEIKAPHNTVARWLAGDSTPGIDAVAAMCRALGIRVVDLVHAVEHEGITGRRASDRFLRAVRSA